MENSKKTARIAMAAATAALALCMAWGAVVAPYASPALAASDDAEEAFTIEADCASCHKKAVKKMNKEGYNGAKHAALPCATCHNEEDLVKVHTETDKYNAKKGDKVAALTKTSINDQACYMCHLPELKIDDKMTDEEVTAAAMELLAEKTADCEFLTDKNGTTVNPHELPEGHFGDKVVCASCHKFHDTKEMEESAANACLGCHHDNVYECGTCHAV